MRKIISQEEKERETRINQIILGVILIMIMVLGTLGYAFQGKESDSEKEKLDYNGVEFVKDNSGYWRFNIQGYDFITQYNPQETKNIPFFSYLTISNYAGKPLYFSGNFQEPVSEISRNLNQFVLRINKACISEDNCSADLPVKNCSLDNAIVIKEPVEESNSISQQENCIFITADLGNQSKYADAFLFKILGFN